MSGESVALTTRIDTAREALALAKDDFDRLRVRDAAAAVRAAAEVIGRRDVQVVAAELVADAERAIAQANPPKKAGRKAAGMVAPEATIPKDQLSKMRAAHAQPDAEYEKAKAEAREAGQPITREALKQRNSEARRKAKHEARERMRAEARANARPAPNLIVSSIANLSGAVPAGSVDAIVTDPPYTTEFVEAGIYRDLAVFAMMALRPGGLLLAILPTLHVERVLRETREAGLAYRWLLAYTQPKAVQKIHAAHVTCTWKPWGAWTKPGGQPEGYANDWFSAPWDSSADKVSHHWGQTEGGIRKVIEEWVKVPGSTVCDPFCGAGSTLVAASELGHRVIGADIDAANVELTRRALTRQEGQ